MKEKKSNEHPGNSTKQYTDRKDKWKDSGCIRITKMQRVSMEKQNSSGKISQEFHHRPCLKKSNRT